MRLINYIVEYIYVFRFLFEIKIPLVLLSKKIRKIFPKKFGYAVGRGRTTFIFWQKLRLYIFSKERFFSKVEGQIVRRTGILLVYIMRHHVFIYIRVVHKSKIYSNNFSTQLICCS